MLGFTPLGTGMNHKTHWVVLAHKPKARFLAGYLVKQLMALSQPVPRVLVKADEPSCLILGTHGQRGVKGVEVAEDFTLPESLRYDNGHALSMDSLEEPVCLKGLFFGIKVVIAGKIPEQLPVTNPDHHPVVFSIGREPGNGLDEHHHGIGRDMINHSTEDAGASVES